MSTATSSAAKHRRNIAAISQEDHVRPRAQVLRFAVRVSVAKRTISSQQEFDIRHLLVDSCGDAQKARVVLVVRIHARHHPNAQYAGAAGQGAVAASKASREKRVADDKKFARGEMPSSARRSARRARIADHRVAPAEGCGLRTKLRAESAGLPSWRWLPITTGTRASRAAGIKVRLV